MDVRKRHNRRPPSANSRGDNARSGNLKAEKLDRSFTRLIIFVFVGVLLGLSITFFYPEGLDKFFSFAGIRLKDHAVVIDAGSTGSRVLAFSFQRGVFDHQLHLTDELWMEVKPGLSSYAANPVKAAESITQLLDAAKERIPKEFWASTPITLKATAGLRLLPSEQADAIINEVEKVLRGSGFKPETPLVEIMNPRDEGLYAWFTVNFLLGKFTGGPLIDTFATLDLGGGSTQITFAPTKLPVEGLEERKHYMHEVTIMGQKTQVYIHSYLGIGLMAAREAIFTQGKSDLKPNNESGVMALTSPCMSSSAPQSWSFHGNSYVISKPNAGASYQSCQEVVKKIIQANDVHVPKELKTSNVAAFSYFYDRAIDSKILAEGSTEGQLQIQSFIDAAKLACKNDQDTFQCIDLTFITSLLIDGYGLTPAKTLNIFKKIDGHETSWALGAAYNLIEGN